MAEISVPAWPIPIHQTKLTIAKPQAVGMRIPQMPTPLIISRVMTMFNSINAPKEMSRPKTQPGVTGRVRTMALILSVTVSRVCPGPIIGSGSVTPTVLCEPSEATHYPRKNLQKHVELKGRQSPGICVLTPRADATRGPERIRFGDSKQFPAQTLAAFAS